MRVRVLCNLGTNDFPETPFCEGEEPEVGDTLGAKLVAMNLAVDITPSPEPSPAPAEPEPVTVVEPPSPKADRFEQMRAKNKTQTSK